MKTGKTVQLVVYIKAENDKMGFKKRVTWYETEPIIGQETTITLYPGQSWGAKCFNVVQGNLDVPINLPIYFFESDDYALFEVLCECLTDKKGWEEV